MQDIVVNLKLEVRKINVIAEFDRTDNSIVIYWPNMKSRKHIIQTLVHEYQHYLQSPSWFKRYYDMGYDYGNHPYEVQAYGEEKNWVLFK